MVGCSCSLNTKTILHEIFKILIMLIFLQKMSLSIIFKYDSVVLAIF